MSTNVRSDNSDSPTSCQTSRRNIKTLDKKDKLPSTEAHEISASSLIEFGTVLLYTCQNSCDPTENPQNASKNDSYNSNYVQEQVMLQSESI